MCNMNKKRWILVGICTMAAAFALIVSLYMNAHDTKGVFLQIGERENLGEETGKAVYAESENSQQTGTVLQPETSNEEISSGEEAGNAEVVVYICGAVKNPGVYQCQPGERISHAVERAGGMKKNASELVNLAEPLSDGQRIYIPTKKEMAESIQKTDTLAGGQESAGTFDAEGQTGSLVNINTADITTLMTLPGIGSSRAQSILDYRDEHGSFSSIEEIMNISGIKDGLFSQIQELITVQ